MPRVPMMSNGRQGVLTGKVSDGQNLASEGDALAAEGLLEDALYKYDEALKADETFYRFKPNHPHVAMRYCSIGALYRASGDDDSALEYFAKAARVEEGSDGCGRRTALASYLSNLGGVFRSKGDTNGANDAYCKALDHLRKALPPLTEIEQVVAAEESAAFERENDRFDPNVVDKKEAATTHTDTEQMLGHSGFLNTAASVLNNLGLLYKSLGEPRSARRLYLRAISLAVIAVGEFDPVNAARHRNLGAALHDMGHHILALERFERAADMCALGYGQDHPETIRANEWVEYAKEEKSVHENREESDSKNNKKTSEHILPPVAEWFVSDLRCGVLEPPDDPPLPEEEEAKAMEEKENSIAELEAKKEKIIAATPEGDDGTITPIALPDTVERPIKIAADGTIADTANNNSTPKASTPSKTPLGIGITTVALAKSVARRGARLFAPLEPEQGEDMLAPYARPRTAVVGGDDQSPMWKQVSEERNSVQRGDGAMPAGRDYIAAYLEQAPGYANLITPFAEMPSELLMPYSAYKGYGVPRPASAKELPRLAHRPRAMEKFGTPGGPRVRSPD